MREEAREGTHAAIEPHVAIRGLREPRTQSLRGPRGVGPQRDAAAVGLRREDPHVRLDRLEAVIAQRQVRDHRPAQPTHRVRDPRRGIALGELGVREGAAHGLGPLEHQDLPASLREERRRDQPVVPRADDDRVVAGDHQATAFPPEREAERPPFCAFSTSRAAIRPDAPMMPPPGCVADPHSHRSFTGVS